MKSYTNSFSNFLTHRMTLINSKLTLEALRCDLAKLPHVNLMSVI